jgi:hypothetical protein
LATTIVTSVQIPYKTLQPHLAKVLLDVWKDEEVISLATHDLGLALTRTVADQKNAFTITKRMFVPKAALIEAIESFLSLAKTLGAGQKIDPASIGVADRDIIVLINS